MGSRARELVNLMSDTLLVSTRKGLFEVRRHSSGWTVQRESFMGDAVSLALVDTRDGTWYAALGHSRRGLGLHRSDDDGESWIGVGGDTAGRIGTLALAGDRPGELWAGATTGLLRSGDQGATWTMVEPQFASADRSIHSILVDPRDSRRVRVGVRRGGVWETTDDGASWTAPAAADSDRQSHRIRACPAAFDRLWAQHQPGIWRSSDGARTWDEIKQAGPSTFGFAVAVHPNDPDTAYFVPVISDQRRVPVDGRMVVTRTRDGGESFDVLRNGLPQTHAYDLVLAHALELDRSGELLALGSTTGNLWISEDAGEHFITVSTHLPPISALCFV